MFLIKNWFPWLNFKALESATYKRKPHPIINFFHCHFSKQASDVSVFETTIRFLGGLLSAYAFSGEEVWATMLFPCFWLCKSFIQLIVLIVRYTCMCIIGWYQSSKVHKLSRQQWKLHYKLWAIDQELLLCILRRLLLGLYFHLLLAFWPVRKVIKTESIRKLYQNI